MGRGERTDLDSREVIHETPQAGRHPARQCAGRMVRFRDERLVLVLVVEIAQLHVFVGLIVSGHNVDSKILIGTYTSLDGYITN